jgi:hypothetical protein
MRITRQQLKKIITESLKSLKLNESEIHVEDGIARDDEGNEFPTDMPDGFYKSSEFKFKGGDRYYHQGPGSVNVDPDFDDPGMYAGPSAMGPDFDERQRNRRRYGYDGGRSGRRY